MSAMDERQSLLPRIDSLESRLALLVPKAGVPTSGGMTSADPNTGEQWEAGQVWGHMAESVPFWLEQARMVVEAYQGEPVPFGRPPGSEARKAGVDRGLSVDVGLLAEAVQRALVDLRAFLENAPAGWSDAVGLQTTGGPLSAASILQTRILNHLEEHATQLEQLSGSTP